MQVNRCSTRNVAASAQMAKPLSDKTPTYPVSPAYKQWLWEEIRRRKWTLQILVDEMKRADRSQTKGALTEKLSTSTMIQFLGPEKSRKRYWSNSELMPAINKATGLAQPPICDPSSPVAQLKDRLDETWRSMSNEARGRFLKAIESILGLATPADAEPEA
jgi:hypothetical protein